MVEFFPFFLDSWLLEGEFLLLPLDALKNLNLFLLRTFSLTIQFLGFWLKGILYFGLSKGAVILSSESRFESSFSPFSCWRFIWLSFAILEASFWTFKRESPSCHESSKLDLKFCHDGSFAQNEKSFLLLSKKLVLPKLDLVEFQKIE